MLSMFGEQIHFYHGFRRNEMDRNKGNKWKYLIEIEILVMEVREILMSWI